MKPSYNTSESMFAKPNSMHSGAVMVATYTEAGKHGDGCFEFDAKCNGSGLGIVWFHRVM